MCKPGFPLPVRNAVAWGFYCSVSVAKFPKGKCEEAGTSVMC